MQKEMKYFKKESFFPNRKHVPIDAEKEKQEFRKKTNTSKFSFFMMYLLISTVFVYYSALMMNYLGCSSNMIIMVLTPSWIILCVIIYHLSGKEKINNLFTGESIKKLKLKLK